MVLVAQLRGLVLLFGLIRHFWLVLKHVFAFYLAYFANFAIFD